MMADGQFGNFHSFFRTIKILNNLKREMFLNRQVQANCVDPDQTAPLTASTLFAILSVSFGHIIL